MFQKRKQTMDTRKLTTIAILGAIGGALYYFPRIPITPIYGLDFSNLSVILGTFAMGPWAGAIIQLIKSSLGLLFSTTNGIGEFADVITGLAMALPAGFIYRMNKNLRGALKGMIVGGICAIIVGVLSNVYILIPIFAVINGMSVPQILAMGQTFFSGLDTIWKFALVITAPFNLLKVTVICVTGWFLYKPLSPILHGRGHVSTR